MNTLIRLHELISISFMEPKLDAPGKGLPFPQNVMLKIFGKFLADRSSWEESAVRFDRNSQKILKLLQTPEGAWRLNAEPLNQRVLVSPIKGLEDSSRYWSVGMTLDHLLITGIAFKQITVQLSQGIELPLEVRIENVKPPAKIHTQEVMEKFKAMVLTQNAEIEAQVKDRKSKVKLNHPWFGKMTAHQWHWLMGMHQGIHLQQIKSILLGMSDGKSGSGL